MFIVRTIKFMCYLVVAVSFLSGCGGGSSTGDEVDEDTVAPPSGATPTPLASPAPTVPPVINPNDNFNVSDHSPAGGSTDRALVSTVSIRFNKPLVPATVLVDNIALKNGSTEVAFELRYQDGAADIEVIPEVLLEPYLTYTVELSDRLMSEDGESLSAVSWQFTTTGNLGETSQALIDSCMSEVDIEMLDSVNNVRAQGYTCIDKFYASTYPLRWDCQIAAAAQRHSQDMVTHDIFSHTGSDGSDTGNRIEDTGYALRGWAENIAVGQGSVDEVMEGWLTSPTGHCQNIMGNQLVDFGSSLVLPGPNSTARYRSYWTQNFALKAN